MNKKTNPRKLHSNFDEIYIQKWWKHTTLYILLIYYILCYVRDIAFSISIQVHIENTKFKEQKNDIQLSISFCPGVLFILQANVCTEHKQIPYYMEVIWPFLKKPSKPLIKKAKKQFNGITARLVYFFYLYFYIYGIW